MTDIAKAPDDWHDWPYHRATQGDVTGVSEGGATKHVDVQSPWYQWNGASFEPALPATNGSVHSEPRQAARLVPNSTKRRRATVVRRALAAADVIALMLAFATTIALSQRVAGASSLLVLTAIPIWVLVAKGNGLYDRDAVRPDHSTVDELSSLTQLVTIGTWILFVLGASAPIEGPTVSEAMTFWLVAIVLLSVSRAITRGLCRRLPGYQQNTIIVGRDATAHLVAEKIRRHPEYGLRIVGFVSEAGVAQREARAGAVAVGSIAELGQLADELNVERVVIASSFAGQPSALAAIHALKDRDIHVDIVPHLHDFVGPSTSVHAIEGLLLLGLPPLTLARSSRFIKRLVDIVGSAFGLILFAVPWLLIAITIKLDSRGPVLFRQTRMGARDTTFEILKFRTMEIDAEARKREIAHLNKHCHGCNEPLMFKVPNDPRVTRVGRILRRLSLDEIPQLVNVLRGEMSLVGPRPLILEEHEQVSEWARKRLELRPGITGLWQVLGRSDIPFAEMTRLDYIYVTSWSMGGDLRLLLRTVPAVFRSRDAY